MYNDDQCAQCGGIRVAKSTLCADCLVALCHREEERRLCRDRRIIWLEKRVKTLERQLAEALKYGFKRNQENVLLQQHLLAQLQSIEKERGDDKDGLDEDK